MKGAKLYRGLIDVTKRNHNYKARKKEIIKNAFTLVSRSGSFGNIMYMPISTIMNFIERLNWDEI